MFVVVRVSVSEGEDVAVGEASPREGIALDCSSSSAFEAGGWERLEGLCFKKRSSKVLMITYSTGTKSKLKIVATSNPPNNAVPNDQREAEPAPVAITRGKNPSSAALEVMTIGRNRSSAAVKAASRIVMPCL